MTAVERLKKLGLQLCHPCGGTGRREGTNCSRCDGFGYVKKN